MKHAITFVTALLLALLAGQAATQTRDGRIQLITSSKHYTFNLAWLKALPGAPKK